MRLFILDENMNPVQIEVDRVTEWAEQYEKTKPLALDIFGHEGIGEIRVSTVFIGCDYAADPALPCVFESRIFGGGPSLDDTAAGCCTYTDALTNHAMFVAKVRAAFEELAKVSGA